MYIYIYRYMYTHIILHKIDFDGFSEKQVSFKSDPVKKRSDEAMKTRLCLEVTLAHIGSRYK